MNREAWEIDAGAAAGRTHAAPSPPPERLLGGNFASPPASSEGHEQREYGHEDARMSFRDEDDYGHEPRRVLKVRRPSSFFARDD